MHHLVGLTDDLLVQNYLFSLVYEGYLVSQDYVEFTGNTAQKTYTSSLWFFWM